MTSIQMRIQLVVALAVGIILGTVTKNDMRITIPVAVAWPFVWWAACRYFNTRHERAAMRRVDDAIARLADGRKGYREALDEYELAAMRTETERHERPRTGSM